MRRSAFAACLGTGLLISANVASIAAPDLGPAGRWDREDGLGGIEIVSCGDALCGRITWLRDSGTPAHVGQEVLFDMRRTTDATWTGSANNPEDGRTYAGTMTLAGSRLLTKGCIFGGLICRSVALSRPR